MTDPMNCKHCKPVVVWGREGTHFCVHAKDCNRIRDVHTRLREDGVAYPPYRRCPYLYPEDVS